MLFVSMNGPRQEVVGPLCVCGATLWEQGKWGLKYCPLVGPCVFTRGFVFSKAQKTGKGNQTGMPLFLGLSPTPEMAREPP